MHKKSLSLRSALEWISDLHDTFLNEFLSTYTHLPSALLTNPEAMTYIEGLGYFVRGADCWCFEVTPFPFLRKQLTASAEWKIF